MQQYAMPKQADRPDERDAPAEGPVTLGPALFAHYRDLTRLRYDFPLVLVDDGPGGIVCRPLTAVINDVLRETAPPGPAGEAQRQHVLRLEGAIRERVATGERDRLTSLWRRCAAGLLADSAEPPFGPLDTNLDRAREALRVDGEVIDCDEDTPRALLVHAWRAVHDTKAREFRRKVDGLILRLSDILKADHMKSDDAHTPEALASSVGTSFAETLDFHALSQVLSRAHSDGRLPEERLSRIRRVLFTLRSQRFYEPGRSTARDPGRPNAHSFIFESCAAALDAFRARLPEVLEFVKALTIAELEVENKYRAEVHDPVFAGFDESDLSAEQLALLPSALVCLRDGRSGNADTVQAFEALASGLPIKVLIQTDDILGGTSPEPSRTAFGGGSARLAAMGMGFNRAYVFQASSAQLHHMHEGLLAGMRYDGPALLCIFSGAVETTRHLPPYLVAAAATESRAFPCFTYDPSAGHDWAARFRLSGNPQTAADWPLHRLDYMDEALQRESEETAFTFADFAACDSRYARYFRPSATAEWGEQMLPAAEYLKLPRNPDSDRLPYVLTIDAANRLHRAIVDEKVIEAAHRCSDAWRLLQELAGINNSHATRLLAQERKAWEAEREGEASSQAVPSAATERAASDRGPASQAVAPVEATAQEGTAPEDGDTPAGAIEGPWIETSRCTTCNECTQINNRLFAYNENMQAYIADPDGGTFRQIVEAAESCQVSIIHPGSPRDPGEPNLEDLIARAEPFN